jgi:hypothetical protein
MTLLVTPLKPFRAWLRCWHFTWNRDERSIEYYRDRHHVAVFGLFEQGSLINWAILWNGKRHAGRFP